MSSETIIYIIIAAITALLVALFQYWYKSKLKSNLKYALIGLRTLSILGILLLLINPNFESYSYYDEKPNLVLAVDNSESISYLNQNENAKAVIETLISSEGLKERFNIKTFSFGKNISENDSLTFNENQSNISGTLKQLGEVYKNETAPTVLISDGNQTYGRDYSFIAKSVNQEIYPLILGDSTTYLDLSIKQLNVNRYAFIKNEFPVEIIANYTGNENVTSELKIYTNEKVIFRKPLEFNAKKTSEIISTTLPANRVGIKSYKVEITPLDSEKNRDNNSKSFGVEVIDQKTNIVIVSEYLHPDIGALKKAIESNEQRSVSIFKPNELIDKIDDFQLIIIYQPNEKFKPVYDLINTQKRNTLTITGKLTNYKFVNASTSFYEYAITNQTEDFQPILNRNYNTFIVENLNFENFPPLQSEFGNINFRIPHDVMLFKMTSGIETTQSLLSTFETDGTKHALLSGEGIWRWRAQSFLDTNSFEGFDNFTGKLVQYLSSNKKRRRLNIDYNSFYNGNDDIVLYAQYFNKNFEFDATAALTIILKNNTTEKTLERPFLVNNGNYSVDLSGLEAGKYAFTVRHNSEAVSISGNFEILEFNVEQQFLNADVNKLSALAKNSDGEAFFYNQTTDIINKLLADSRYQITQKSTKNIVPLIDWKYLLGIIALSLFAEWFIRKYNGLI